MTDDDDIEEILARAHEQALHFKPLCEPHHGVLLAALIKQGLKPFLDELQDDPELVLDQGRDMMRRFRERYHDSANVDFAALQELITPTNFQPTMVCLVHLFAFGQANMCSLFYCVVCQLNDRRNPDGSCRCSRADCSGAAPGSIPPFEDYLEFLAEEQGRWARERGMIE